MLSNLGTIASCFTMYPGFVSIRRGVRHANVEMTVLKEEVAAHRLGKQWAEDVMQGHVGDSRGGFPSVGRQKEGGKAWAKPFLRFLWEGAQGARCESSTS